MFGFFDKKYDNPSMIEEIRQIQDRWFMFLEKLESRMDEMCTAALPELKAVFEKDHDPYKRAQGNMVLGLLGQLNQMRLKANQTREENIVYFIDSATAELPPITSTSGRRYYDLLYALRITCLNRHAVFEEKIAHYTSMLKDAAGEQDLEAVYQDQLNAFEKIRDQFNCMKCGGRITISKMFFIATYVNCSFCHTQNTFLPSTAAQMVLHHARSLAEHRTAHLLKIYENSKPRDPALYQKYLRSMFNEWNKIVPDMAGENEKFYERLLEDYSINYH